MENFVDEHPRKFAMPAIESDAPFPHKRPGVNRPVPIPEPGPMLNSDGAPRQCRQTINDRTRVPRMRRVLELK